MPMIYFTIETINKKFALLRSYDPIVCIIHSIIVIDSSADFMKHSLSGLVSIDKFK